MRGLTLWKAYLAGVLHGDGWCTKLSIGMRVKDKDFSEAFAEAVNVIFGTSLTPRRDERGYWLVRTSNKTGRFSEARPYEPIMPDEVGAWLRGFFDSEGNADLTKAKISLNAWHRRVSFYSTDYDTIERARGFLEMLGIKSVTYTEKPSAGHKGKRTVYQLRVRPGRDNYFRFAFLVGSSIKRKDDVLNRLPCTYQPPGHHARAQAVGAKARVARRDKGGKY